MALSITLFSGVTLYQTCVGRGVSADNMVWLKRKTNTVMRFGISSWLRGQQRLAKGRPADDPLLGPDFAVSTVSLRRTKGSSAQRQVLMVREAKEEGSRRD